MSSCVSKSRSFPVPSLKIALDFPLDVNIVHFLPSLSEKRSSWYSIVANGALSKSELNQTGNGSHTLLTLSSLCSKEHADSTSKKHGDLHGTCLS